MMYKEMKIDIVKAAGGMEFWKVDNSNQYNELFELSKYPTQNELVEKYTELVQQEVKKEMIRKLSVTVNDETFSRLLLDNGIDYVFTDDEFYGSRDYYMIDSTGSYINHFKKWDIN